MYVPHNAIYATGNLAHLIGSVADRNPSWFVLRKCTLNERVIIRSDISLEREVRKYVVKISGHGDGIDGLADVLLKGLTADRTFKQAETAWVVSALLSTSEDGVGPQRRRRWIVGH